METCKKFINIHCYRMKCPTHTHCSECRKLLRQGYRAALEWVKNHPDLGNQFHMTEAINKELEQD